MCAVPSDNEDGETMLREGTECYVNKINSLPGKKFELSISVGVYISSESAAIDSMLKEADKLMYREKNGKHFCRKN